MKRRVVTSSVFLIIFFSFLAVRIGFISLGGESSVNGGYNSYSLTVDVLEPNIYYSNYSKLTNNKTERYLLLKPNEKTAAELPLIFSDSERIIKELSQGKPILIKANGKTGKYIKPVYVTQSENTCRQLISAECSGLLKYLPEKIGFRKMKFTVDAKGRMLSGDDGEIVNENYSSSEGLLLTLDEKVQSIAYNAAGSTEKGCVVIMDVKTSSLLACVTKPDSSYINKAFSLYSAGSVFKLVTAAAALENGVNITYKCKGKTNVGDTVYSCQKSHKHGKQTLKEALANSCNCYFINLALNIGYEKLIDTAKKLGFGDMINVYGDMNFQGSVLPDEYGLKYSGELPLLSFGQGKLMCSPVQLCSLLCTIGNGGMKNPFRLVTAEIDKYGNKTFLEYNEPTRVLSEETCNTLLGYMRNVVENGTGKAAEYKGKTAGKTATAQTGQYENGRELLNTWFIGVYPYDNPKYAIAILCEDGKSGFENCCPVFRTIVENLD